MNKIQTKKKQERIKKVKRKLAVLRESKRDEKFVEQMDALFSKAEKIFEGEVEEPFVKINMQGRNEMCSCGSGKKYKKCHLNK